MRLKSALNVKMKEKGARKRIPLDEAGPKDDTLGDELGDFDLEGGLDSEEETGQGLNVEGSGAAERIALDANRKAQQTD